MKSVNLELWDSCGICGTRAVCEREAVWLDYEAVTTWVPGGDYQAWTTDVPTRVVSLCSPLCERRFLAAGPHGFVRKRMTAAEHRDGLRRLLTPLERARFDRAISGAQESKPATHATAAHGRVAPATRGTSSKRSAA